MSLKKVRIQLLNELTGDVEEEVDVLTSADCVKFEDGETLQEKLDSGELKGPKGDTGPAGPAGADGAKGEQGEQGPAGPAGADGSDWFSGSSVPASSVGKNGDFYLHTSTYDIYKKNSGAWEKIGNIKGAAGAKGDTGAQGPTGPAGKDGQDGVPGAKGDPGNDGTDGATWLFGASAPSSQGKNGDFYLNTSNYDVYQKNSNTWNKKGNIKGASGAKGDKGDTGPAGKDGDNVRVGTEYATAQQVKLFFKTIE